MEKYAVTQKVCGLIFAVIYMLKSKTKDKKVSVPFRIVSAAVVLIIIAAGAVFYFTYGVHPGYDITVIKPTCTDNGYSIYKSKKDNSTQIKDIVKAKGHTFGDWTEIKKAVGVNAGERSRLCKVCGFEEKESYFNNNEFPRIMFYGSLDNIGKKDKTSVAAKLDIGDIKFDGYATLKYQGHSSLKYPKKNFTVKFYEDESHEKKKEFQFSHWNKENKYILKANYIDTSRCRNLICADIWAKTVSQRKNLDKRFKNLSNYGAVDGFPAAVYLNDDFIGTFNVTLHKDENLFGMREGEKDGIMIINACTTDAALFKEKIDWKSEGDWEVEYCGTDDKKWIQDKMNKFIGFVINSDDGSFKKNFSKYADKNSVIDYMISMYMLGLNTSYAKDLIFVTYDDGPWTASLFDMENAFGLFDDGSGFHSADYGLPSLKNGKWVSGTDSLLWDRVLNNFDGEIIKRYAELRKSTLSVDNIVKVAKEKISMVPSDINKADFKLYGGQPQQNISHAEQIEKYVTERAKLLDGIFNK